jgi:hypothetical protein
MTPLAKPVLAQSCGCPCEETDRYPEVVGGFLSDAEKLGRSV